LSEGRSELSLEEQNRSERNIQILPTSTAFRDHTKNTSEADRVPGAAGAAIEENQAQANAILDELRSELAASRQRLQSQGRQLAIALEAVRLRDRRIDAALRDLHARDMQIRALYSSTSWRLTRPLRVTVMLLRGDLAASELAKRVSAKLARVANRSDPTRRRD
jgi:hypothetical protein